MAKRLNYFVRSFSDMRNELVKFIRQYYPETLQDFDDSSVGSMLLELGAGLGEILAYSVDNAYNEVHIDYAQERRSLYNLAKTNGVRLPNKRGAVTICDFSIILPVRGSTFDLRYAPLILKGAQVMGGGQMFETLTDIDFSSPFSSAGVPNRSILPIRDSIGRIVNYQLVKRELVFAGKTKFFKRIVSPDDVRPNFFIDLPDEDVLNVEEIIELNGTNFSRLPTLDEQTDPFNKWYYVSNLAENKVFVPQPQISTDNNQVMLGFWQDVQRRFTYEFSNNGFCRILFGAGVPDVSTLNQSYSSNPAYFREYIQSYSNAFTTGAVPIAGTTLFVKYRVGGGTQTNIGAGVLTAFGDVQLIPTGDDPVVRQQVANSLRVNNPIPAYGGKDMLSIDELRSYIRYHQATQNRAVTLPDFYYLIATMDSKFGVPFQFSVADIANKIEVTVLGQDSNGNLTNESTQALKLNLASYLKNFRVPGTYISVVDGKIINLRIEIDVIVRQGTDRQILSNQIRSIVLDYFASDKLRMGADVFVNQIEAQIQSIPTVQSLAAMRFFNPAGNSYSLNTISQPILNVNTRQIDLGQLKILVANYNEMFEIKFKERDIVIRFAEI